MPHEEELGSMPIQITVRTASPVAVGGDIMVVGIRTRSSGTKKKGEVDAMAVFDRALGGGLSKLIQREEFKGKKDQSIRVQTLGKLPVHTLFMLGLGDSDGDPMTDAEVRSFAARAARAAQGDKARRMVLVIPEGLESRLRFIAEGLGLGAYRFDKYLTGDRRPKKELEKVVVVTTAPLPKSAKADVALGEKIAAAVNLSRDLSNEPPNELPPVAMAEAAQRVAKENGLKIEVFDAKEIHRRGMHLLRAVGQGSVHEPRFVHVSYIPKGVSKKRLAFVGKGITFDSGGISIKPAAGMGEMKHDMSGAGNMVGLMAAVAALQPPVEVHAFMACAENMPDGNAYRPGDVWGSLDGKSVEIINTDAEGRLVLADALAYARTFEPDLLVDNATLTGACVVALGNTCSGFYASNEETANEFSAAVKQAGEQMWRMPLLEELKEQLKSDVADLKHTGDRWGGSITAALFLREFIGDTKNWIHADIAGPATAERASGWSPKGATGHGVLTYIALVERAANGSP
jgi:leucyl aminopeptidase